MLNGKTPSELWLENQTLHSQVLELQGKVKNFEDKEKDLNFTIAKLTEKLAVAEREIHKKKWDGI